MGRLSFFLLSSLLLIAVVFADTSNSIEERNSPAPGGIATRYWDCCKPSGAWPGKADVNRPVQACAADGFTRLTDPNAKNGCEGGTAFGCNQHKPFRSKHNKKISFAFAAMSQSLGESNFECACYALKFNELKGKTLIVQATNTGGDVPPGNFDIQIPGGGAGIYNGCQQQYSSPADGWGARYGGVSSIEDCDALPSEIRSGCRWRFRWFADNPKIYSVQRVRCPKVLTRRSGCKRNDDIYYPRAPE